MSVPVFGFEGQLGADTVGTVAHRFNFGRSTLAVDEQFIDCNQNRGTLAHDAALLRTGNRRIGGQIDGEFTAVELVTLLPWGLGGAISSDTIPLSDTRPALFVAVDKVEKVHHYNNVVVNKLTVEGAEGQPLKWTFDVLGGDESIGDAGTFPSLTLDTTTTPFVLADIGLSGLQVNSAATLIKSFRLVIDYHVQVDFFQSQTATNLIANDRTVSLYLNCSYGLAQALYGLGVAGTAVTLTFTNGDDSNLTLLFSFVKVCFPRKPIAIEGRNEIMVPMEGIAYKSGGVLELITVLASSP